VCTSSHHNPRNHRSATREITQDMIVAQVRYPDWSGTINRLCKGRTGRGTTPRSPVNAAQCGSLIAGISVWPFTNHETPNAKMPRASHKKIQGKFALTEAGRKIVMTMATRHTPITIAQI